MAQLTLQTFVSDIGRALSPKSKLDERQAASIREIMQACDRYGVTDIRQRAYILATAWHETRLRSIREIRAKEGTKVWKMQQKYWHTGFQGRGLPQLTGRANYEKFGRLLGVDLVRYPDKMLDVEIGAEVLVMGMVKGYFTKHPLSEFFPPEGVGDYWNARRTVNGVFHADLVALAAIKLLPVVKKYYPPKIA